MSNMYTNKIVLITGGAGSIGKVLLEKILELSPKIVRVLDINETALHEVGEEFKDFSQLRLLIGDIRDKNRIIMAMENVDIVFHAAALKHVPLCEYNPFEATKTNIVGTQNVIEAALANNVDKMITISTDKATAPINVMGASKLLAEKLTIAANFYRGDKKTKFSCVRFGNVLGSRGSIVPVFVNQLNDFKLIKITEPEMTRFLMRIDEAVTLVLKTISESLGGEIFVLKMPSAKVKDLSEAIVEIYCEKNEIEVNKIKVEIIGRREGEKTHEDLITDDEIDNGRVYFMKKSFILIPSLTVNENPMIAEYYEKNAKRIDNKISEFSSATAEMLNKNQIKQLIFDLI